MDQTFLIGQFLLLVSQLPALLERPERPVLSSIYLMMSYNYEEVESFELHLLLDPLVELSGVIVEPNVATVCIEDDDGKSTTWKNCLLCYLSYYRFHLFLQYD